MPRRLRFLAVACLLGLASFYAGTHFVATRPAPPIHPLTGRQIAGIATDANWLDRATREQEEAPEQALTTDWDSTRNGCRGRGGGHRLHDDAAGQTRRPDREGVRQRSATWDASRSSRTRHEPTTCRTSRSFRALKPTPVFRTTPSILRCSSTSITSSGIRRRCCEAFGGR